ncbi:hypothetical protein ACXHMN_13925 [Rhizobium sp. LEGMi12c]
MDEGIASLNFAKIACVVLRKTANESHQAFDFSLRRRSLLLGSAGALFVTAANAALPADDLEVVVNADEFTVTFAGRVWRLRHGTVGVESRVRYKQRPNGRWPIHEIAVENGAWPGTGQDLDFTVRLSRRVGETWKLNFFWATSSSGFDVSFPDWLDGRISGSGLTQKALTIGYGLTGAIAIAKGSIWALTPDWKWHFMTASGRMVAPSIVSGDITEFNRLLLSSIPGNAPEVADYVGTAPARYLTRLRLEFNGNGEVPIVRWTARDGTHADIALSHSENCPADIYAGIISGRRRAFVRMDGPAVLRIGNSSSFARRIILERAVVAGEVGIAVIRVGVAARIRSKAQIVSLDPGTVTLRADDDDLINFSLTGEPIDLRIKAELLAATFPIDGADLAELTYPCSPLHVTIGAESQVEYPQPGFPPQDENATAVVRFSAETSANLRTVAETLLPLSKSSLRVLRARDLMDLRFRFRHMSLAVQGRSAMLVAHRGQGDGDAPEARSLLIVEFPGQSKLEQAFDENSTKPPFLPEAYLAGPTRLVFDVNLPPNDRLLPFNAYELTRWANYSMVVIDRALPADASIATQLKTAGVAQKFTRGEALQAIRDSLRPPRELETQIELPAGLVLTPSSKARWLTSAVPAGNSNGLVSEGVFELWSASIDQTGPGPDFRFVWTRSAEQFRRDFNRSVLEPEPSGADPFRIKNSLSEQIRLDLVILTSMYGLPALRRLLADGTDDVNGQVLPAPPDYSYIDVESAKQEGIYIPRPIAKDANLSLTSLSAMAVLSGTWVPPLPYANPNGNETWCKPKKGTTNAADCGGISLQALTFRQVLEGGVYVRVSEKGYLFPSGHLCSRLEITERKFFDRPAPPSDPKRGRGPTAYDAKRTLLVVDRADKSFPALNQPSHGRRLPARLISLLTQSTPMLVDPFDDPKGGLLLEQGSTPTRDAYAFWPRIKKAGVSDDTADFIWEYMVDGDPNPVRSPLLFVNNGAATSSAHIAGIVAAYNATVGNDIKVPRDTVGIRYRDVELGLRRATLGGKQRRYAEGDAPNQTSFETAEWLIAAEGRDIADTSAAFTMDAYMNGQDQPPFYPLLDKAQIRVQSIERLSGEPNVSVWARPADIYVENGFANNNLEIFLRVLDKITVDLSHDTSSGGGLANPKLDADYLTKKGPISKAVADSADRAPARRAQQFTSRSDVNVAVRPDATLLGMIHLCDLLPDDCKPKIVETAVTAVDKLAPVLRDAVDALAGFAGEALQQLQRSVAPGAPTFATLYPALSSKLETLLTNLVGLRSALGQDGDDPTDRSEAIDLASAIHANITGLLDEINAIARNPVPALAGDVVETISSALETVRNVVNSAPTAIRQWVEAEVESEISNALDDLCGLASDTSGLEMLRLLVGEGDPKEIQDGLRWLIGANAEAFKNRIESAAGTTIDNLKGEVCRQFAATTSGAAILQELLGSAGAATACDDPDGLPKALNVAAQTEIADRVGKIQKTLFYDVFGSYLLAVSEEVRAAIDDLIDASREGEGQLSKAVFKIIQDTTLFAIKSGQFADIAAGVSKLGSLCDAAITAVQSLTRDTMKPMADIQAVVVGQIEPSLGEALNEAGKLPSPLQGRAISAIGDVRTAVNNLSGVLKDLNSEWQKLPMTADVCQSVNDKLSLVRLVIGLRRDALQSATIVLEKLSAAVDVLSLTSLRIQSGLAVFATDDAKACRDAIGQVGESVVDLVRAISSVDTFASGGAAPVQNIKDLATELQKYTGAVSDAGKQLLDAVAAAETSAKSVANRFNDQIKAWQDAIANGARDPLVLRQLASDLLDFAAANDLHVAGLVARAVKFDQVAHEKFEKLSTRLSLAIAEAALKLYGAAIAAVTTITQLLGGDTPTASYLRLILKADVWGVLNQFPAELQNERDRFMTLQTGLQDALPDVRARARRDALTFFEGWTDPAVARAARAFAQLSELLLRGHFDAVFDLTLLKNALEAQLSHFIPTTARVSYEIKTDLKKLDEYGFDIDEDAGDETPNDLELTSLIEVNLLSGARKVTSKGHLKPSTITLFPGAELLIVSLGAVEFRANEGSGFTVDRVDIRNVGLKGLLKYLEPIANLLQGGGDSGPYYVIDLVERFIRVGFRIPPTDLSVGTFAVLNASLDIAVILRLQDKPATLLMQVGTRSAPVMVIATPYGGAMFLGLEAGAKGFTAVEICIEFGAMAALSFPPFSGWARVVAGLYFSKQLETTTFSGFVQAAGEGSLACFSIAALLEVGMKSEDGKVSGFSFYSFSFKVGFVELSYGFTAEYDLSSSQSSHDFRLIGKAASPVVRHLTRAKVPRRDTEWAEYKRGYAFLADELL